MRSTIKYFLFCNSKFSNLRISKRLQWKFFIPISRNTFSNTNHWKICMVQVCRLRWYGILKHSSIVGEKEKLFKILVFQSLFLFSWFFYNLFVLINFILPQEKRTTFCFLLKWFYLKILWLDELCHTWKSWRRGCTEQWMVHVRIAVIFISKRP